MPIDRDTYRKQSLDTWAEMASGWEDRREWLMDMTEPVSAWLLDKVDPRPGETILEIAAGTGDLGLRVAERVGQQGRVISTDFAPEMVDVARRQGESRGLTPKLVHPLEQRATARQDDPGARDDIRRRLVARGGVIERLRGFELCGDAEQ